MNTTCKFCGASVDSSEKLCPGCGKVMPAYRGSEAVFKSQFSSGDRGDGLTASRLKAQTPYAANRSGRMMDKLDENYGTPKARKVHSLDNIEIDKDKTRAFTASVGSGKDKTRSIVGPGFANFIKFIIIIIVGMGLYIAGSIFRIMNTGYNFKLSKDVEVASSYSKAFNNYFEEKHWGFDLSKNAVTFKGKNRDGVEYSMVFGRSPDGQTAVKELSIDGVKKTELDGDIMNDYMIVVFTDNGVIKHASALGKGVTESSI
ncbi:MAG: zinc ribbon domain-containing protein [Ruminococcus sp.]|nr:zinc ribbon domain-containing protein [Ruminococcus sp.]